MKTLLIVDDDALIRRAARRLLQTDFADILEASCGEEALQILEDHKVDRILSDVMMQNGTGAELHQALPDDLAGSMVLMTGGISCSETREYVESLGNKVLKKPFDRDALKEILGS